MMIINSVQSTPVEGGFRAAMAAGEAGGVQQTIGGDAFAQLLLTLFGSAENPLPQMGQLSGEAQPALSKDSKENTDAMQMMAELLATGNVLPVQMLELMQGGEEAVQSAGSLADILAVQDNGAALLSALTGQELPVQQNPLVQSPGEEIPAGQVLAETSDSGIAELAKEMTVLTQPGSAEGEASLFDGQMKFRQSVSVVQKALQEEKEQNPAAAAEALDLEALQQRVNAQRPNMAAALQEKANAFQTKNSMVGQMADGILKNLNEGNEEFTIQLKPESLGEITIKMTQNDGKISMSIVTASAQTAKLLNESVEALKNALRPLQAEVREIVPRPEQSGASQQSGFFGSGFESFQHSQQFADRGQRPQYFVDLPQAGAEDEEPETADLEDGRVLGYI